MFVHCVETIEQYRKENDALQEMLLGRGLTKRQLQKEKNALLKSRSLQCDADVQFAKLREAMKHALASVAVNPALLAKIPVFGKPQ